MCLGDSMARLEIFLMFSNLIRQFKFTKYGEGSLSATHVKENHPISSAENFQVMIEERCDGIEVTNNLND
jgi:cytochrome P450